MSGEAKGPENRLQLVLVARKGAFGLPTACPSCLPVYLYLRLCGVSFDLQYDVKNPDSDHIPFVELGDYVAYDNEKGGVINGLKEDGIVDLDSELSIQSFPEWLSMKAMVCSWLVDAALFELWVDSDGSAADAIYFSDLPWPIRKALHWKQSRDAKNKLGITKANAVEREEEIYRKAKAAYEALSSKLSDQTFFFENRSTSLDAFFLGHSLFVLQTLPESSALRNLLLKHDNLVKYSENLKKEFLKGSSSSSSIPRPPFESSTTRRGFSPQWTWSSKPKPKPKRERTEEEKTFRRRAKYFLATQLVAVIVFLTLFGSGGGREDIEMGDDDDLDYDY